ncbi:MAG: hypothetical protein H7Y36_11165, partial [Armatimonadetes bacterium]|nr:hypothetical protein [Akkermansiaceae bacterium]
LLIASFLIPEIDEWNPVIDSDSDAWGSWEGEGYRIELKQDSTFTMKEGTESKSGNWRRMDYNLYLSSEDSPERYMRFVEEAGDLLLLPKPQYGEPFQPGPITKKR